MNAVSCHSNGFAAVPTPTVPCFHVIFRFKSVPDVWRLHGPAEPAVWGRIRPLGSSFTDDVVDGLAAAREEDLKYLVSMAAAVGLRRAALSVPARGKPYPPNKFSGLSRCWRVSVSVVSGARGPPDQSPRVNGGYRGTQGPLIGT